MFSLDSKFNKYYHITQIQEIIMLSPLQHAVFMTRCEETDRKRLLMVQVCTEAMKRSPTGCWHLKTLKACLSMLTCVFTYSTKHAALSRAVNLLVTMNILVNSVDRWLERRITVSCSLTFHFWVSDSQWPEVTCCPHPQRLNAHAPCTRDTAGTKFLWNGGKHLLIDTASLPRTFVFIYIYI